MTVVAIPMNPRDEPASVCEQFRRSADRWPQSDFLQVLPEVAQHYGIAPCTLTYAQAMAVIDRLAAAYRDQGLAHGQRVGLLLENRPAFFLNWLALNGLGVSVVPISAELRAAELEYLVGHSEISMAVVLPARVDALLAAARAARRVLRVVPCADEEPDWGLSVVSQGEDAGARIDRGAADDALPARDGGAAAPAVITPDTECALLYTSGTTGRPKGCVLANEYFLEAGRWYAGIGGLCALQPGQDRLISPLPMTHMNAMAYSTMAMIRVGGCVVPLDRFHPRSWWSQVAQSRATIVHYLGVMPAMLIGAEPSPDDRRHAVRFGFGAGVDRRHHAAFEARFGFPLLEAWAMTETGAGAVVIANREPREVGTACFGRAEPAVQWRLVDEAGHDVPVGTPGELLVRAAGASPRFGFFREYLKDREATDEAWRGGWFHTGDLVRADAQGSLYFIDRRKNVIRRSGENISAVEVESVLRRHPQVADVAVAATPDPVRGDEVLACVIARAPVPPAEQAALAESIVALALEQLAYYKAPGYVAFVDALPLTATQKVQRGELKALAQSLPGQSGCIDTRALKRRQADH